MIIVKGKGLIGGGSVGERLSISFPFVRKEGAARRFFPHPNPTLSKGRELNSLLANQKFVAAILGIQELQLSVEH